MNSTFRTKTYEIYSEKIRSGTSVRFALLSDLHGVLHGVNNQELYEAIISANPDAILIAGDMIVTRFYETYGTAISLLSRLADQIPTFYSLGNHEYKALFSPMHPERRELYRHYEKILMQAGVCFLHNDCVRTYINGNDIALYGLELPVEYYHKPNSPKLSVNQIEELIGKADRYDFSVLLAHNPKYGRAYFKWGGDLTVSGHYHGGVVRLSENHGLSCPQFLFLPPYCCGKFQKGDHYMIVSAGIGEHTIPMRIHNPRELLLIDVLSKKKPDER